jgi:hypothetical protein
MTVQTGLQVWLPASWQRKPDTDDIQHRGTHTSFRLAFVACSCIHIIVIWVTAPALCRFLYDRTTLSSPVWNGARLQKDRQTRRAAKPSKAKRTLRDGVTGVITHSSSFCATTIVLSSHNVNVVVFQYQLHIRSVPPPHISFY